MAGFEPTSAGVKGAKARYRACSPTAFDSIYDAVCSVKQKFAGLGGMRGTGRNER